MLAHLRFPASNIVINVMSPLNPMAELTKAHKILNSVAFTRTYCRISALLCKKRSSDMCVITASMTNENLECRKGGA